MSRVSRPGAVRLPWPAVVLAVQVVLIAGLTAGVALIAVACR